MTNDEKIDEHLAIVKRHEGRFDRLETFFIEERKLNNDRFTQLAAGLAEVRQEVKDLRVDLNAKIDKVHDSLSADINAFGEELFETKRRVTRLEKKLLS